MELKRRQRRKRRLRELRALYATASASQRKAILEKVKKIAPLVKIDKFPAQR